MSDKLKFLGLLLFIGPMAVFYQNEAEGVAVIFNPVVQIAAFKQPVYYARFRALFLG